MTAENKPKIYYNTYITQLMTILLLGKERDDRIFDGQWVIAPNYFIVATYDPRFKEYKPVTPNVLCYLKMRGLSFQHIIKECLHTVMDIEGKPEHVCRLVEVPNEFYEELTIPAFALYEVLHRIHFSKKKAKPCKNTNGSH